MEQRAAGVAYDDRELSVLVRRWQTGDADAASELYRRCRPELVGRMRRYAGSDADAEDLAHDVWLRVVDAVEKLDPERPLWHWLGRVARNHGIDTARRRRTRVRQVGDLKLIETQVVEAPDPATRLHHRDLLEQALDGLPARQREAVLATALLDHDPVDVADRLGLTANGLRQLLHRSRTGMRTTLDRAGVSARDLCLTPVFALRRIRDAVTAAATRHGNASTWPPVAAALAAVTLATAITPGPVTVTPTKPAGDAATTAVLDGSPAARSGEHPAYRRHAARPPRPTDAADGNRHDDAERVTPPVLHYAPVTLPNGTTISAGPDQEPDYAYGLEADIGGEQTHVVGQESYDESTTSRAVDARACHVFDQGLPGTYCRGHHADSPPGRTSADTHD